MNPSMHLSTIHEFPFHNLHIKLPTIKSRPEITERRLRSRRGCTYNMRDRYGHKTQWLWSLHGELIEKPYAYFATWLIFSVLPGDWLLLLRVCIILHVVLILVLWLCFQRLGPLLEAPVNDCLIGRLTRCC